MKDKTQTAIRIDRQLLARIKAVAEKEHRTATAQLAYVLEKYLAANDGLFVTRQRRWQRVKELALHARILHDTYPHCLRSTCAIDLAHKGISSAALQYLLGWARLSSAEDYVRSDRTRALREVDEIYG